MTEVAKGPSNLAQWAIRGNYRAVAAQAVDKAYSRNIAHRELSVSDFAQSAFGRDASLEYVYLPRIGNIACRSRISEIKTDGPRYKILAKREKRAS